MALFTLKCFEIRERGLGVFGGTKRRLRGTDDMVVKASGKSQQIIFSYYYLTEKAEVS